MSGGISSGGSKRAAVLDILRGLALVEMIVYHGLYDWVYVFGRSADFMGTKSAYWWQQSICWLFILLSGAALNYGRRPLRRGAQVLLCGLLLTIVTVTVMPSEQIWFGVLHFLGCAGMLCGLLRDWLKRVPSAFGAIGSFLCFAFLKSVPSHAVGFLDIAWLRLPSEWYTTQWLFPLGFPGPGFVSADYFPVIPWLFLYLAGFYFWRMMMEASFYPKILALPSLPLWSWLGQHSLLIYLLHQPVLMVLVAGLNYLF